MSDIIMMSVNSFARPRILVVTATAGYRHESIPTAERVLVLIGEEQNVDMFFARTVEDLSSQLSPAALEGVTAVFFVNTTGEPPLASAEALLTWVREGGTFVGIHSASDTWHTVPAYIEMLGGEFIGHPPETNVAVIIDDSSHMATHQLTSHYEICEEFYYLGSVDFSRLRTLLSIHIRPEPPWDTGYWPLAWEKRFGKGRVLYSALGHREDVWRSGWFSTHIAGIVSWAVSLSSPVRRGAVFIEPVST
jgi:type 1 glutamine amidotransferase